MDVQERRDVPEVEEADVAQVDRLLEEHRRRDHTARDEVPGRPHVLPVLQGRDAKGRGGVPALGNRGEYGRAGGGEEREHEGRALEEPERVLGGLVCPALDGAESGVDE